MEEYSVTQMDSLQSQRDGLGFYCRIYWNLLSLYWLDL